MTADLRAKWLHATEQNLTYESMALAHQYLTTGTDGGRWRFVRQVVEKLPEGALGLKPMRVALLASFSIQFADDTLIALGFAHGLRITTYHSGFAQYHQEMINPQSQLYAFQPDMVILAIEGERLIPDVYKDFLSLTNSEPNTLISNALNQIQPLINAFRDHSNALLLIHNLAPSTTPPLGILDGMITTGQTEIIHAVNGALLTMARTHRGVLVVDYAALVAQTGARDWYDLRMAYLAKSPIAQKTIPTLVAHYLKYGRALAGLSRKCLVTDLDNTLWGGVIGEEGVTGIKLGSDYPGSAFVAFQHALLQLYNRGILLAIASKNNPDDVAEVFQKHPSMLLKSSHFAAQEIHWQPKSTSLIAIAKRLNIGLEHLVFIDDNPVECEQVKAALPMVTVIQFPSRAEEAIQVLNQDGWFDALNFSIEDQKRSALYRQKAEAEALQAASGSLTDFYFSLNMTVEITQTTPDTLARTAQLTQKTNQFNLTTLRYSEEEVAKRIKDPDWLVLTTRVIDRFGDNGIVGVIMAHRESNEKKLLIDTFLLSCRVIGRTVETAMLAYLCQQAPFLNVTTIQGCFVPTAKNSPAKDLYQQHHFVLIPTTSPTPTSENVWELDLTHNAITIPPWIHLTGDHNGSTD